MSTEIGQGTKSLIFRLDIKHLVAFDAIYDTRNLSRAARLVGFAQPTMSNLLAHLREVLEDPLFERRGGGMVPTSRANEVIGTVRDILSNMASLTEPNATFDPKTDRREFHIHIIDLFETLLMPRLLREADAFPGISYRLLASSRLPITETLESGEADLALGMPPPNNPDLIWEALLPIEAVVIARRGHPEIDGTLTREQFERIGHVTIDLTPGALANGAALRPAHKIERRDVVRVTRPGSVLELVAGSNLIGLAHPAQIAASPFAGSLQVLPLPMPNFHQNFQMTWHRRNKEDQGLIWLMDRIRSAMREKG